MTRLSLTLPASPLETPTSYLSRLAARNLIPDLYSFCGDLGFDLPALINGDTTAVQHLCALAGLPRQTFEGRIVVKTSTMKYRVGAEGLNTETLSRGDIRYCPRCLAEALAAGPVWSAIFPLHWQLIHVRNGWTCEPYIDGNLFSADELPTIRSKLVAFHAGTKDIPQRPGFLSSRDLIELEYGGDVDLRGMPADLVGRCRGWWSAVSKQTEAVVHGDINRGNLIRCPDGNIGLIDWDECRRDLVLFDMAVVGKSSAEDRSARLAWEVACSWRIEPEHARQIASRL